MKVAETKVYLIGLQVKQQLEILQSLGGLYDGLALYPLHWS